MKTLTWVKITRIAIKAKLVFSLSVDGIEKLNVLTCDKPKGIDAIITNPPFFAINKILDRALFEWKIPILLLNVGLFVNFREMVKWFEMARTRIVTDLYKKPPIDQAVATNVLNRLETHIRYMFVTYAQEFTDVLGL